MPWKMTNITDEQGKVFFLLFLWELADKWVALGVYVGMKQKARKSDKSEQCKYNVGTHKMKIRQSFAWLEYIFLKKEDVYLTTCFSPFSHLQMFKIYLLYKGNCCSLVMLVVVLWLIFVPSVCTCWCVSSVSLGVGYCCWYRAHFAVIRSAVYTSRSLT
jgi:hypothetical protein